MYKKIFVDQCGYQPQMKKYVTFQAQEPVEFSVLRSDGECVMKGSTDKRFENASAKEIDYIGSIVYELENSTCVEDVQEIFEEISENVVFRDRLKKKEKKNKTSKKKKQQSFSPIEYDIGEYKIYVGRNNKENDWLTLSFANKTDLWFHTKDVQRKSCDTKG